MNFQVHWLEVTVWGEADQVRDALTHGVLDRHDVAAFPGVWLEHGPGSRVKGRRSAFEGFDVLDYDAEFCGVRVKGEGCDLLGHAALADVLSSLHGWRWRVSRLDVAWDGFGMHPAGVHRLVKRGHVRTRSKFDPWFIRHETGCTSYSHQTPMKRGVERWFRVYDRRGDVRFEWVLRGEHAAKLGLELAGLPVERWNHKALEALRGWVDFLDVDQTDATITRQKLHPAWAELVGSAGKWRPDLDTVEARERHGLEIIGLLDGRLKTVAPLLLAGVDAYGCEWVCKRLEYWGRGAVDESLVAALKGVQRKASVEYVAMVPEPEDAGERVPF